MKVCQSDIEHCNLDIKIIMYCGNVYFIFIFYSFIFTSLSKHNPKIENVHENDRKCEVTSEQPSTQTTKILDVPQNAKPTSFEIRAVLMKCSHHECQVQSGTPQNPPLKKSGQFIRANNHVCSEPDSRKQKIKKCNKKILVTAHMHNKGILDCKNQYVVIDHVYDPLTDCQYKLFNPYILKMKQKPVIQSYSMIFDHIVNSKAREVVHNKNEPDYKGCNTGIKNSTCKPIIHNGQKVPYSSGFCCPCDTQKKLSRNIYQTTDTSEQSSGIGKLSQGEPNDAVKLTSDEPPNVDKLALSVAYDLKSQEPTGMYLHANDPDKLNIDRMVYESSRQALMGPLNFTFNSLSDQHDFHGSRITPKTPIAPSNFQKSLDDQNDLRTNEPIAYPFRVTFITDQNSSLRKPNPEGHYQNQSTSESISKSQNVSRKFTSDNLAAFQLTSTSKEGECNTKRSLKKLDRIERFYHGNRLEKRAQRPHPRGGQDCQDNYTPPNVNPATYHDSAHCIQFSEVWYSVYRLEKPILRHSLQIQIFEKFEDPNGNIRWHCLTQGSKIRVGTEKAEYLNSGPTVSVIYTSQTNIHNFVSSLDPNKDRLLIPDTIKSNNIMKYPEVTGGPPEYLVVPKNMISPDGKECDKVGVGFEGFNKQHNRCGKSQGSCLENQPSDFWQQDHKAESEGKKGKYFLKFHGSLPDKPVKEKCADHSQTLSLYYECEYSNLLELEFRADHNTVLKPHASAIITEVYLDSTRNDLVDIKVKVLNSGLVAGIFYITLADCPLDMPASFNNIASKPALIPPQLLHSFDLSIHCGLPQSPFRCTVHVLNTKQEIVAARKLRVQQRDRCFCIWYCRCSCFIEDGGLKCWPLSLDAFTTAGFQGSLPVSIQLVEYTFIDDVLSIMLYLFMFLCSTLLIMGLTKALIGWCCCLPVGHWGFDVLLNLPKKMNAYYEPDLIGRPVEYSPSGWPIHPDTRERVRNIPSATEFCLNLIFFFIYPIMLMTIIVKRMCGTSFSQDECETCCYGLEEEYCTCQKQDQEICPCCK